MTILIRQFAIPLFSILLLTSWDYANAQLPTRYATLELFTNTPCPICGSQNPGFFDRLEDYEGQYHLISWYPGKPYSSCIFYQANIDENTARFNFYPNVFGTPTVIINGTTKKSSGTMTNAVLDDITGGESWLSVGVEETGESSRNITIDLEDNVGGSLEMGKLFAVIVEREIMYNAPNGETLHHNVFREFLTDTDGDDVDLSSGSATMNYQYTLDLDWQQEEVYVIAWLMDPETKEIYNSGTKFDNNTSSTKEIAKNTLHIFPNPATDQVTISLEESLVNPEVTIFDGQGKLIRRLVSESGHTVSIDTGNWPSGTYQVQITEEGKVRSGRFQVVR